MLRIDVKNKVKFVGEVCTEKIVIENKYLSEKKSRQIDKEMRDCKESNSDGNKAVEKYIDLIRLEVVL